MAYKNLYPRVWIQLFFPPTLRWCLLVYPIQSERCCFTLNGTRRQKLDKKRDSFTFIRLICTCVTATYYTQSSHNRTSPSLLLFFFFLLLFSRDDGIIIQPYTALSLSQKKHVCTPSRGVKVNTSSKNLMRIK